LTKEDMVLAQYENYSSFFTCKYYPPTEYDVSQCGWAAEDASFMIRYHRRRIGTLHCASRFEMVINCRALFTLNTFILYEAKPVQREYR
uniref:Myotubularin phosphatase domain-containing protein n=1 Tax=Gongylonema pulchrum TaxID=637853 RepID=A0A183D511_9BILA